MKASHRNVLLMDFLRKKILFIIVFLTGGAILIIEILAARLLSPFFGNTIYTYSSIISVVLGALSVGYYVGGRWADKRPFERDFYAIIFLSGVFVFFIEIIIIFFLQTYSSQLSFVYGPLIASCILFFIPSALMGMLSPYAIKLQSLKQPEMGVGRISGGIFFFSTLGSICGSLATGFYLIPNFGVDSILIVNGFLLILIGFCGLYLYSKKKILPLALLVFIFFQIIITLAFLPFRGYKNALYRIDGMYEQQVVFDGKLDGRPVRFLRSELSNSSAMYLDSDELVYEYTKYFDIYKKINPHVKEILVLGAGAYSLPKAYLKDAPSAHIDVVEIEPVLYDIAKKFFQLKDDARLANYTDDARRFLIRSDKKYDVIFADMYFSLYSIPSHTLTQEFFSLAKNHLSENGVFIINVIGELREVRPSLALSVMATLRSVFDNTYFFAVEDPKSVSGQNLILMSIAGDTKIDFNSIETGDNESKTIIHLNDHLIDSSTLRLSDHVVFTDRYVPSEKYVSELLKRAY